MRPRPGRPAPATATHPRLRLAGIPRRDPRDRHQYLTHSAWHPIDALTCGYNALMGSETVCACGCERPVTSRSNSPDFASEHCQTAWNLRRLGHIVARQQPPQVPQPRHAEDPWAGVFLDRGDWPDGVDAIHTPSGILLRHPR